MERLSVSGRLVASHRWVARGKGRVIGLPEDTEALGKRGFGRISHPHRHCHTSLFNTHGCFQSSGSLLFQWIAYGEPEERGVAEPGGRDGVIRFSLVTVTGPGTIVKNELPWRRDDVVGEPDLAPRQRLRACDLPAIMDEEEWFDAYRFALIQFVADWNRATDPALLVFDPAAYRGADWRLLPTIASVVHALAARGGLPVPEWVWEHKAPRDWVVFADPPGSFFWNRDRKRAPATCVNHGVYFHHRLLDKGTPDWWLPWD